MGYQCTISELVALRVRKAMEAGMDGLVCSPLDAGVILWLQQQKGWTVDRVEHFLYEDCGLKGMSGVSNDMRTLQITARLRF